MKNTFVFSKLALTMMISMFMIIPMIAIKSASADMESDKVNHQRKIQEQIQEIEAKIANVKENYKEDGMRVNKKIEDYERRITEIRRDAQNNGKSDTDIDSLVKSLNKDFNEWRLKRSIRSYEDKISDIKEKASDEADADRKAKLEEKAQKLEAQYNAVKAKLNDLRMTNAENWDRIEKELDADLDNIEREYKETQS